MKHSLGSRAFQRVFKKSKSLLVGDLFFKFKLSDAPAIGFAVSRKYGNSVKRHLFKRRCRMCFQNLINKQSIQIIILPKTGNISFGSIQNSFRNLEKCLSLD